MRPEPAASLARAAPGQLLRFVAVGAVCTALQYLLLILAVEGAGADVPFASGASFAASAVLNYVLNRRLTFGAGAPHRTAIVRFLTVAEADCC